MDSLTILALKKAESGGGGGGGSNWTLLASKEFTVDTSSTAQQDIGTIELTLSDYNDPQTVLWVHVRDKAGRRTGYFYGSDAIFIHYNLANNTSSSSDSTRPLGTIGVSSGGTYLFSTSTYGVYGYELYISSSDHYVKIRGRYSDTYGTINGTYKCDVYKLTMPSGMTLFEIT